MLKFKDLSKSQKDFIVRTLEKFPEYRTEKTLGAKQIHASYYALKDERGASGEKLGYPNWLQKENRVGRGTYEMPWPTASELSDYAKPVVAKTKAKVTTAKVVKTKKVAKVTKAKPATDLSESTRLEKIIDDSVGVDEDVEDFNQILRDNGIEV
jgi:hypothetical protein